MLASSSGIRVHKYNFLGLLMLHVRGLANSRDSWYAYMHVNTYVCVSMYVHICVWVCAPFPTETKGVQIAQGTRECLCSSELLEFQGACAAVDDTFSHKYYLIVPTWAVLSQGTGEAMQVQPVCVG